MARIALSGSIDDQDRVEAAWSAVQAHERLYVCHFAAPGLSRRSVLFELEREEGESPAAFAARVITEGARQVQPDPTHNGQEVE